MAPQCELMEQLWDGPVQPTADPPDGRLLIRWGATLEDAMAQGIWTRQESHLSSNQREMLAVLMALRAFLPRIKGHRVLLKSDNATTVAYVNNLGGPVAPLYAIARETLTLCAVEGISLRVAHVPSVDNVVPDRLSRLQDRQDWMLAPWAFQALDCLWGPHSVDRFASPANAQMSRFNSRHWSEGCLAPDTLAQDWEGVSNWVCPPFALLPEVVQKLRGSAAQATIVCPWWPAQPWMQELLLMATAAPILIPQAAITPGRTFPPEPLRNPWWCLVALRVSGGKPCPGGPLWHERAWSTRCQRAPRLVMPATWDASGLGLPIGA